jgi:hypothetical protein
MSFLQIQSEGAPLQDEGALRQMKRLLRTLDLGGKQAVASAGHGAAQGRRRAHQGITEVQPG